MPAQDSRARCRTLSQLQLIANKIFLCAQALRCTFNIEAEYRQGLFFDDDVVNEAVHGNLVAQRSAFLMFIQFIAVEYGTLSMNNTKSA